MRHKLLTALCRAIEDQPVEDSQLPDPWLAWLVVCLLRQTERQRWMLEVIDQKLLDRSSDEGPVPGYRGWEYVFHGMGCHFTSEDESIGVDFHERPERTIDPYFFAERLHGLKKPEFSEKRLCSLLPTIEATVLGIDRLRALGVVGHPKSEHVFRLAPEFEALADKLAEAVFETWREPLGDFEGVAGHPRSAEARRRRCDWFLSLLDGPKSHRALEALALELDDEEFLSAAEKLLAGPAGPAAGTAVQLLSKRPTARFSEAVPRLLRRMKPGEDHPFTAFEACEYLLFRGREMDLAKQAILDFGRAEKAPGNVGNPFVADFAMLALEFHGAHALELVRLALKSPVPMARTTMAAVLVLLDKPWTRRELECVRRKASGDGWLKAEVERQREWADRVRPWVPDELPE